MAEMVKIKPKSSICQAYHAVRGAVGPPLLYARHRGGCRRRWRRGRDPGVGPERGCQVSGDGVDAGKVLDRIVTLTPGADRAHLVTVPGGAWGDMHWV